MDCMIREMLPSDWKKISRIYRQGIELGIATFQTECPSYEEWDNAHLRVCRYVALVESEIAGFVALSTTSKREVYRGVVEVSIYLDEHFKQRGIGTSLMKHLCEESEKQGFWSLYSCIIADNTASIHLHKKCGFREIGYREKIAKNIKNEWKDTVLMEKRSSIII